MQYKNSGLNNSVSVLFPIDPKESPVWTINKERVPSLKGVYTLVALHGPEIFNALYSFTSGSWCIPLIYSQSHVQKTHLGMARVLLSGLLKLEVPVEIFLGDPIEYFNYMIDELNKQNLVSLSLRTPAEIQILLEKGSWN